VEEGFMKSRLVPHEHICLLLSGEDIAFDERRLEELRPLARAEDYQD